MIGVTEAVIIGGIVLLLFGAKKLPELARGLGQSKAAFDEGLRKESPYAPTLSPSPPADPSSEEDEDKDDTE